MGLARSLVALLVLVLLCALGSVDAAGLRVEEAEVEVSGGGNLTAEDRVIPTRTPGYEGTVREAAAESRRQQVTRTPPAAAFLLKLRVVDALSGRPLSAASVHIYVNFTQTSSSRTRDDGEVWFNVPRRARAVISALASKQRYVPALLPVTTEDAPVFSSVTLPLLGVNPGNMWLFDDSVLVTRKSTGMFGATPAVQFPRSALNLTRDDSLSAAAAFINSPSLWPGEGAALHTMGIVSAKSGPVAVSLSPVASAFVQLVSSSSSSDPVELNVSGPVSLSLSVSEGCGLQDGDHVPAWTLDHSAGAWVRRGLGTVQSLDGRLVWTFAAPHLGHWMAAPLSPSRGVRLELHVDFLLRHGSFLMILLGSTLTVAVCLLVGLLCCPRSPPKESKLRRPAVNPLHSVKDQSTSTGEDLSLSNGQYNVAIYDAGVLTNADGELRQTRGGAVTSEEKLQNEAQSFGNGLFFYNQPVAILHAPAFFQTDEEWSRSQDSVAQNKITNKEKEKEKERGDVKKKSELKSRAHSGFPESVSEPGTTGPRAWFVSLEGKPAAEIRYAVSEEQRRSRAAESRDTSLDSGLDLTEPGQARRDERKLERNATFLKKNISSSQTPGGAGP